MSDNIFGNLIDPEQRLATHRLAMEGVHHAYRREPLDPLPGKPLGLLLTTGGTTPYDIARVLFTTDGSDPAEGHGTSLPMQPIASEWDGITWGYLRTWRIDLPPMPAGTLLRYRLQARRPDTGEWVAADDGQTCALWIDNDPPPAWAAQARTYQIFPDRFSPGEGREWNKTHSLNDLYGGTLRGMIEKLDYIQALGFNTLWLNPFFKTSSHHGYNASDYYAVEPRLGTGADLAELIEKAHAAGMRILLDFVANHWSRQHFTFQEAQKDPASPYHDWYTWKHWPDDYECYFNVKELPKINLQNPAARAYMLDVARHWLKQGFDGYRLDFAYGPSHDFWVDFRRACREVKPDCWIFGEIIQPVPMLLSYTGIMDGTLDFFLTSALRQSFALGEMPPSAFEAFLAGHEAGFPAGHMRPSFLDNHDEERFLHLAGNDRGKLRLAALVMYTLSGPPIVYAGTETGLSQERPMMQNGRNIFEEARLPMNWEQADADLQQYFRRLNHLRASHPMLATAARRVLLVDDAQGAYAYLREQEGQAILVALNLSKERRTLILPQFTAGQACDALSGCQVIVRGGKLEVTLPPQTGAWIEG